jgi:hypothetical protein
MNKKIWIGLAVVIALIGGWLGYRHLFAAERTVGSLVPPGALLVIASDRLQDTTARQVQRTQISLRQIPVFDEARQRLDRFLYATADTATVLNFITGKDVHYSLHTITRNNLDFIFYIPLDGADDSFLRRLTNPDPRQYRVLNHTFSGQKILDLVSRSGDPIGSFILTDNFLIGSASGILTENVARNMNRLFPGTQPTPSFKTGTDLLAGLAVRPEVLESLFSNAGSLVKLFLPEQMNLLFRRSSSQSHLIGYAVDDIGARRDVAALFTGQTPRRIQAANLIPLSTATLYHIGISDATRFGRSLSRLLGSASSDFLKERFIQIEPATVPLYKSLGPDIMLCRMESPTGGLRQVLVLTSQNGKQLVTAYQQAAFLAGAAKPQAPRNFLGHKTLLLQVPELPASLFSNLFSGFSQSWITQHGSSLIVANSEETMLDYLQQIQRGATWASDERQLDLLRGTLRPANFTAFARLNRAETIIPASWPLGWQNLLDHPDPALVNLENMAYQASYGNENILSTVVLGRTTRRASQALLNKLLLVKKTELDATLISAPVLTGSLSEGPAQFYAHTSTGQFWLVMPDGEKTAQQTIDGPIRSNTLAVDFLNNGRLQYLFMTDRTLYVTDPGQPDVRPERIALPRGVNPTYLTRPRGSLQRNLAALVSHEDGHIYALDRQQKAFVRIMTSSKKAPLLPPFQVVPKPTGMHILAAQADGTLHFWQENGTELPHFPIRVERTKPDEPEVKFAGPALVTTGQTDTDIHTVTDEGQLIALKQTGMIAKRSQLYRPVRNGVFQLLPDVDQTDWLLLRNTDTEIAILDQQGRRRFEVRALLPGQSNVRYHRLGAGIELISVKSGNFTSLYYLNGKLACDRPIPSDFPVTLQFDERTNELFALSNARQSVLLYSIRIR